MTRLIYFMGTREQDEVPGTQKEGIIITVFSLACKYARFGASDKYPQNIIPVRCVVYVTLSVRSVCFGYYKMLILDTPADTYESHYFYLHFNENKMKIFVTNGHDIFIK